MPRPDSNPIAPAFSTTEVRGHRTIAHLWLYVVLAIVGVTYWRFLAWLPSAFYGDDLYNILATRPGGDFASSWSQALTGIFYEKYRPVFVTIWYSLARFSNENLDAFLLFNGIVHTLNAALFYFIALGLSNRNRTASIVLALVFASSRFALYQVTQGTGAVEAVAFTFFLAMLLAILRMLEQPGNKLWPWMALCASILAVYTHERYLAVSPWLAVVLFCIARKQPGAQAGRYLPAIVSALTPALNFLVKTTLLGSSFFVGTGSTHLNLNLPRIVDHFAQALLSVLGINHGPDYLVGHDIIGGFLSGKASDGAALLAAVVATGLWVLIIVRSVSIARRDEPKRIYIPAFLFGLFVLILLPPALTIRIEQRWLYAPFCLFLLTFAWACGIARHRTILPTIATTLACLLLFSVDTYLPRYFPNIYMMNSSTAATLAKRDIVEAKAAPVGAPLVLLASKDHCKWTFIEGRFFELYEGKPRQVYCEQERNAFDALVAAHPSAYVFAYDSSAGFKAMPRQAE
ncbi:hypothetical protein [Cupriavidus basilensis]